MPWNLSASRQGSARPFGSALPGVSSSAGGLAGGIDLPPRGSRYTTASPLVGRGRALSRQGSLEIQEDQTPSDIDNPGDTDMQLGADELAEDFQLYGPAAAVDTQTAAQSQWVAATLENEAYNFLAFLDAEIQSRAAAADDLMGQPINSITLDELLPPAQNTKVVGAQALLHVLSLATKELIEIKQEQAFGDIAMTVVGGRPETEPENEYDAGE